MTVFIAIGIILSAAVACCGLGARFSKAADSRGFAMQTLIVTAVFVFVAAGVAVVIVAVTRGSSDNLEGTSTDIESPEARYGVLTPDGEVSKTWRCALHQETVFTGSGQEYLQCRDRCWGRLSTQGKKKWNWLFTDQPPFGDVTDFTQEEQDAAKAIFSRDDFDGIVFSASDPGPSHPKIATNGAVIALTNRCILTQEICEFPPERRESLVQRWRNSVESVGTDGLPSSPSSVSDLLGILRDCT